MTQVDKSKLYIQYIEDVLSGKEIAGWFIRKACERARSWFGRDDIELRYEEVDKKIRLVQKITQKKGLQAGKHFNLLPFQQFIFMNIFGWYYVNTDKRVIKSALLMMARQTGKSYIAAAISLAIALDPSLPAPSVDYLANSSKQAAIAFGHCKDQAFSLDPKGKIFSRFRSEIRIPMTGASINILAADDSKLDGRASYFIMDELHEMKDWKLPEVMLSGQGSLKNPLAIFISTTGWHASPEFPLYNMWEQAKNILNGNITDDSSFYMIFQLDDEDDWKDPEVWKKAIPTLGVAVDEDYIKNRIHEATINPSKEVEIKTKNLNLWCQSETTWITNEKIKEVTGRVDYDMFDPDEDVCIIGVDLAERSDLCTVTLLVHKDDIFYFKAYPFICRDAYENSKNKDLYRQWVRQGYLILVDEESIDINWVVKYIQEIENHIPIAVCAYDPYHANQLKIECKKEGIRMRPVRQGLSSFAEPTSVLEHLILTKQCVIDDNPVIRWCFSNVLIKTDENENKKPVKSGQNNKIDIVVAMIQSVKLWMELEGVIDVSDLNPVILK